MFAVPASAAIVFEVAVFEAVWRDSSAFHAEEVHPGEIGCEELIRRCIMDDALGGMVAA